MPTEAWIEFAKGPLFVITFVVMVLGLGRQVLLQVYFLGVKKGRRLKLAPWSRVVREAASWVIPVRHIEPGSGLFSVASYLMHVGLLAVPLFLVDHIALWEGVLGMRLPSIGKDVADILTLLTIYCGLLLLALLYDFARTGSFSASAWCE